MGRARGARPSPQRSSASCCSSRARAACAGSWLALLFLRSFDGLFLHHGAYASDVAAHLLELAGIAQLLRCDLHAQAELRAQQAFELLLELGVILGAKFARFHEVAFLSPTCGERRWCGTAAWRKRAQKPRARAAR